MGFKLDPKRDVGAGLRRVMREEIAAAIAEAGRRQRSWAKRIHRARLATKKVRAVLKLVRSSAPKLYRTENRRLGRAARAFSAWRDADAMLACFASLLERHADAIRPARFDPVSRALRAHRRAIQPRPAEVRRAVREFVAALRETDRRLSRWKPDLDFDALAEGLRRSYRRARRALRAVRRNPTAEKFHAWRKATKACGYQCRLLRAAWRPAMKELGRELKELGGRLGDEHDFHLLAAWLTQRQRQGRLDLEPAVLDAALALIEARRQELQAEARLLGERAFADRPAALARRMTEWWRIARAAPEPGAVSPRRTH